MNVLSNTFLYLLITTLCDNKIASPNGSQGVSEFCFYKSDKFNLVCSIQTWINEEGSKYVDVKLIA